MKWFPFALLAFLSCNNPEKSESFVIAIGSCNNQSLPQPMWEEIVHQQPDLWIWLGDNIYGDSQDPQVLKDKYNLQLQNAGYQKLLRSTEVIGTWDDHDYGVNDGGKENPAKDGSQEVFLDFLDVAEGAPIRDQKGVYSTHDYEVNDVKIKVVLLDARYFRDALITTDSGYAPNPGGTILGETQWKWLEEQLKSSDADIHLIGNGIQILAAQHRFEKWANFPKERERLLRLIATTKAKGVILLSGDRHIAEVSEIEVPGVSYPIRDITTSGLTHSYEAVGSEPNNLRISPLIGQKNYCLLTISQKEDQVKVSAQLRGLADTVFYKQEWMY